MSAGSWLSNVNMQNLFIHRKQSAMYRELLRVRMVLDKKRQEDAAVLNLAGCHAGELMDEQLGAKAVNLAAKLKAFRVERVIYGFAVKDGRFHNCIDLGL